MPSAHFLQPLESCSDPALVGGKAAGLGRLMRSGFHVPPGLCLTTDAFRETLKASGIDLSRQWTRLGRASDPQRDRLLEECRRTVAAISLPQSIQDLLDHEINRLEPAPGQLWAIRSSVSDEDAPEATLGGQYRTVLGVPRAAIPAAIVDCWTSLWSSTAFAYRSRLAVAGGAPAIAVLLQPLLAPRAAGVAYSRHPVSRMERQVVINAVFGLADALVGGSASPDQYVVEIGRGQGSPKVLERIIAEKLTARRPSPAGLVDEPLPDEDRKRAVLSDEEAAGLARLIKDVEAVFQGPVDVEWAMDDQGIWLLQARPIPGPAFLSASSCVWSRANFKETMPELPSPLGLSFLKDFMEHNILRHYLDLGCTRPPGLSSVRIFRGRPYINVTLFQSLTAQLGGDPAVVLEHMGGEESAPVALQSRLAWWRLLRAAMLMEWKIRRAARLAPRWFAEMKVMALAGENETAQSLTLFDLRSRLDRLDQRLKKNDLTLALVAGVSQGLQVLDLLLQRRIGPGWRPLLNASLRGVGTVVSSRQILWLAELAEQAQREPIAQAFFMADPWEPQPFRARLAGTRFLSDFNAFLAEYGHRAFGESDPVSPRFSERPEDLIEVIRLHLKTPPAKSVAAIRHDQEMARIEAFRRLRRGFGWRLHEWVLFRWWHRRLNRFLALREANRHHLMYFTARARHLEMILGEQLVARGLLCAKEDIFFLTAEELRSILVPLQGAQIVPEAQAGTDWKVAVAERQAERARHASQPAPDMVADGTVSSTMPSHYEGAPGATLRGLPISAGYVEGPVRLLRSPGDANKIIRGDILVAPVIDPGMAPLLGLAAGLVVEMGGILSHGAIIAREYGLPAVANVHGAMDLLRDGERIAVDASAGEIHRLSR